LWCKEKKKKRGALQGREKRLKTTRLYVHEKQVHPPVQGRKKGQKTTKKVSQKNNRCVEWGGGTRGLPLGGLKQGGVKN